MLGPDDDLPRPPRRVLVAGVTGSGKTTCATRIATLAELPRVELDALHHGPQWVPRPEFATDVARFSGRSRWVCEWQYAAVRDLLAARADTLVWLDLPFRITLRRVVRRTARRRLRREVLWNGNVEAPLWTFWTNPDHIVRWAMRTRHALRTQVPETAERFPQLQVVHLTSPGELERWLHGPLRRATGR